jgi:hypothetical protein
MGAERSERSERRRGRGRSSRSTELFEKGIAQRPSEKVDSIAENPKAGETDQIRNDIGFIKFLGRLSQLVGDLLKSKSDIRVSAPLAKSQLVCLKKLPFKKLADRLKLTSLGMRSTI